MYVLPETETYLMMEIENLLAKSVFFIKVSLSTHFTSRMNA